MIQINALLEKISLVYNKINHDKDINLNYQVKPVQIKDVNTSYLDPYIILNRFQSFDFMSNMELFTELLKILEVILKQSEKFYLLKIDNIFTLLRENEIKDVLNRLYHLSDSYHLNIISFAKNEYELFVKEDLIDSILICGDYVEQLDTYVELAEYLTRNYPKIYDIHQGDLLKRIQSVSPYLISQRGSHLVQKPTNQVFFVLLNQAMGYSNYDRLEYNKLNNLEWKFLEDNLYKLF